jgi:hypothetical protein
MITTLDATHNGRVAYPIPFTQLSTMLIHHQSHTTFHGHNNHGQRHGMHDPRAFNFVVKAVDEETLV